MNISRNLRYRLLLHSASFMLFCGSLYFALHGIYSIFFWLLASAMICVSLWEFYHLVTSRNYQPLDQLGILCTAGYLIGIYLAWHWPVLNPLPETILGLSLLAAFCYYFFRGSHPFINLGLTFFGLFYLTVPLSTLLLTLYFPGGEGFDGRVWVLYTLVVTKITDTAAYTFGKLWGKTKLSPYISPKKTWEGAIAGFVAALATSVALMHLLPLDLALWQALFLGCSISILAQFGDLAESLLKRDMNLKDSNQVPGIGGVLDIVDSLVFTAPFIYLFLKFNH